MDQYGYEEDANNLRNSKNKLEIGLETLFDKNLRAFVPNDESTEVDQNFYPGCTCQLFPEINGVTSLSAYFDDAWIYLEKYAENWHSGKLDQYPWAVIGYVAAHRKKTTLANLQINSIENIFLTHRDRVPIHDLSYYLRTKIFLEETNLKKGGFGN